LIHGLEGPTGRTELEAAIEKAALASQLHHERVVAGDVVFVPAGVVHAIGEGQLMYEIQQKSDTTYRLYDWGRMGLDGKPRDLHVEQSLDVLDYTLWPGHLAAPLPVPGENGRFYLAACRHFALELWTVNGSMRCATDGESFSLMTVVEGSATLRYGEDGDEQIGVGCGDTVLVPAELGWYSWETASCCKLLRAYVPDLWMDIVSPLLSVGSSPEDILRIGGYGRDNHLRPLLPGS
jgi:mannose-6-phosphate isomerase